MKRPTVAGSGAGAAAALRRALPPLLLLCVCLLPAPGVRALRPTAPICVNAKVRRPAASAVQLDAPGDPWPLHVLLSTFDTDWGAGCKPGMMRRPPGARCCPLPRSPRPC